ncbi:MAG: NAD(P)H-hydrate dehydratase [Ruminococcaceae bacterium]|nr:NAD(P)H-hydrate dehydratase [Oscillospiraceae bacterium]
MKLVTAAQMAELEQKAINEYGISSLLLMENAARGFCDCLEKETGSVQGKPIVVYCGSGNNGGDGFAIARHLYNRGGQVTVVQGFCEEKLKPDAKTNFEIVKKMGLPVISPEEVVSKSFSIVVDALFGTGFHGVPKEQYAEMIESINQSGALVVAVDIPSGAGSTDGQVGGACVRADLTVTFGLAKVGQFLYPAKEYVGKLCIADISIPLSLQNEFATSYDTLDSSLVSVVPKRSENSHKGSFGKVLAFAGSPGMSGACVLASLAVLKAGAGTVTAAIPESIMHVLSEQCREVMTMPLPTEGEQLSEEAVKVLLKKTESQDVLLAGCGLGNREETQKVLLPVVMQCMKPLILDADGINLLAGNIHILKERTAPTVLTPHPLEFSRLSGHSMEDIRMNRVGVAREFACEYGVVLVLKGADTVVAHPDGKIFICENSNSGLATAGSGDVLSGIIASLMAQGASAEDGANLGVYLHSSAGLLAREKLGARSMLAGDVLERLPEAIMMLEKA